MLRQRLVNDETARFGASGYHELGAVLLLSSHFSDMVVGHVLMVDGGWTLH